MNVIWGIQSASCSIVHEVLGSNYQILVLDKKLVFLRVIKTSLWLLLSVVVPHFVFPFLTHLRRVWLSTGFGFSHLTICVRVILVERSAAVLLHLPLLITVWSCLSLDL